MKSNGRDLSHHQFGKMGPGRVHHKIADDLDRALASLTNLSRVEGRIIQHIREMTWRIPAMQRREAEPCEVRYASLARLWRIDRSYLRRQFLGLVKDGILSHEGNKFEFQKDVSRWVASGRIEPADLPLIILGYERMFQAETKSSPGDSPVLSMRTPESSSVRPHEDSPVLSMRTP